MTDLAETELKKKIIKDQHCFALLNEEETEVLSTLLTSKTFSKGETVVTQGDPVDSVYIIVKGECDVLVTVVKDNQLVSNSVATLKAGDAIGLNETGFYSLTGMRTATVVAKTDLVLFQLSVPAFHGFALAHSHVSEVMRQNANTLNDN